MLIPLLTALSIGISPCAGAKDNGPDFDSPRTMASLIREASLAAKSFQPAPAPAQWTVMVYLNAKNDLVKNAYNNIRQMERVGSTKDVKIVVEFATIKEGSRRMLIGKRSAGVKNPSPALESESGVDMGDWRRLADFSRWSKQRYPAKHYLLVVWSHGSGWRFHDKPAKKLANKPVSISGDDETGDNMSVLDIKQALRESGGADLYASDACLMQQAEVAYELKDLAHVIVGSEGDLDVDGFAYDRFLKQLVAAPGMNADEAGRALVQAFRKSASDDNRGTLSAIRTAALPRLLSMLSDWADQILAADESKAVEGALDKLILFDDADRTYVDWGVDIGQLVRLVGAKAAAPRTRALSKEILAHISSKLVIDNTHGNDFLPCTGLSVYLTRCEIGRGYDRLAWAKDGSWLYFLKWVSANFPTDCPLPSLPWEQEHRYKNVVAKAPANAVEY